MARPTKWNKQIEEKALAYIDDYQMYGDMIPSIEGMAEHLGLHRDTLYDWAKQKDKGFWLAINSGTIEMNANKIIVLAD